MKILELDYDYYNFPQCITTIEDFIEYINNKYSSFIPMIQYQIDNCSFPYLIEEETKTV